MLQIFLEVQLNLLMKKQLDQLDICLKMSIIIKSLLYFIISLKIIKMKKQAYHFGLNLKEYQVLLNIVIMNKLLTSFTQLLISFVLFSEQKNCQKNKLWNYQIKLKQINLLPKNKKSKSKKMKEMIMNLNTQVKMKKNSLLNAWNI